MKKEEKMLKYIALMQVLYEMSDDIDLTDSIFNTKIIKDRCFDLMHSCKKQIWKMYRGKKDGVWQVDDFVREEDWDKVVQQHSDASAQMIKFFDIGLSLAKLDDVKSQGFNTQLNILLKTYGIHVEED